MELKTQSGEKTLRNIYPKYIIGILAMTLIFASLIKIANGQNEQGNIVARIDFNPTSDGFRFRNYGSPHDGSKELDASDLILMFGAENVCIEGTSPEDCVLYETANKWMRDRINSLNGGRCDGFSVASMRTWQKLPFKEKTTPNEWQENAEITNNLKFSNELGNYIAYYHSLQGLKEVNDFRAQSFNFPPSGIVRLLIESFQNKEDFYTLGVGMRINGRYSRGHSILPIAVEDMGNNVFRIHVYDNNFPNETKYVTVDSKNETWQYRTASDPSRTEDDYTGSATSKTFSLKKMSDRNREIYNCPFCQNSPTNNPAISSEGTANYQSKDIYFSFIGKGNLLITDSEGKKIGFDSQKRSEENQISGAEVIYDDGGLGFDYSPRYVLPFVAKAKNPYQIKISGNDLEKETNADLEITLPGFVVGLEDVLLDPNEDLTVSISPDGKTLNFTASADSETPNIFITTEAGPDKPSYSFEVGGITLDAGKTVTMSFDVAKGKVYFKDNDGNEDAYNIYFERTNANGTKIRFDQNDLEMKGRDSFEVDINKWDEKNQPCVKDDDDGDGFEDEPCGDDKK